MITFDEQVAIVAGAGQGLGRSHALSLAERGVRVVVNDLGGARDGTGASETAAETVVAAIVARGGEAIANPADATDRDAVDAMVAEAIDKWGGSTSSSTMPASCAISHSPTCRWKTSISWSTCTSPARRTARRPSGTRCGSRTTAGSSSRPRHLACTATSGGPTTAAKLGVVGLMNTLRAEGAKYDIRVNALAPGPHTNDR